MIQTYPDVLALPGRPRELAVFNRKVMWDRATFQMWPRRFLGAHGCDTFAGTKDAYGGKQVLLDLVWLRDPPPHHVDPRPTPEVETLGGRVPIDPGPLLRAHGFVPMSIVSRSIRASSGGVTE